MMQLVSPAFFPTAYTQRSAHKHTRAHSHISNPSHAVVFGPESSSANSKHTHHRPNYGARALSVKMPFRVCISVRVYVSLHINRHPHSGVVRALPTFAPRHATLPQLNWSFSTEHSIEREGWISRREWGIAMQNNTMRIIS
jgi:hypothetical protein